MQQLKITTPQNNSWERLADCQERPRGGGRHGCTATFVGGIDGTGNPQYLAHVTTLQMPPVNDNFAPKNSNPKK